MGEHRRPQPPVLELLLSQLQAAFPEQFGSVELDGYYRAINRVKPSFIRVEADEATYNLHIILRFELEREIMAGTIDLKELPEAWNARFEEYLGIKVPDDAHGVLQDVHWSGWDDRLLPDLCARQPDLRAAVGAGAPEHSRRTSSMGA